MRIFLMLLLAILALPGQAPACFGPKLFLGMASDPQSQALGALVMVYVKEKTGVETLSVPLEEIEAKGGFDEEKADMVLTRREGLKGRVLLALPDAPVLIVGRRPAEDLQFSTVVPSLEKLSRLLKAEHLARVVENREGEPSLVAAARRLLKENRWI